MQRKINNTVICLQIGKKLTTKTSLGDFRSPLPKLYYYHNKRLQVKESQVSYQPTVEPLLQYPLNPYSNTQLDLFYSDNSPFLMHDSQVYD